MVDFCYILLKGVSVRDKLKKSISSEKYPAGRPVQAILPKVFDKITRTKNSGQGFLKQAWAEALGPKWAPMTEIIEYKKGIIFVRVNSAIAYSELALQKKAEILEQLQKKLPSVRITQIVFRR